MKRAMLGLATVAVAGVMSAAPALANNVGTPPGPPLISGGPTENNAEVLHCQSYGGSAGVIVLNQNGVQGNGACHQ